MEKESTDINNQKQYKAIQYERGKNMETITIKIQPKATKKINIADINDDTILLAVDEMGGMCDRLMKGRKGIVANANATIQAWKANGFDDEEVKEVTGITDDNIAQALIYLETDNFTIYNLTQGQTIVTGEYIVGRNLTVADKHVQLEVVDLDKVEFNENNLYSIL